jgi:transposase
MREASEIFVGIDTSKARNAVALAEAGREGEVRFYGEIANTKEATTKLLTKLESYHQKVSFCYEAGPTGYGLYRQITDMGQSCIVVAPSLIPKRPGDRVKTNKRDAVTLARLLRAGELTAVWVPDEKHEAIRDLARARDAAVRDYRAKRQQITSFLLRHGRYFPGRTAWSKAHSRWLAEQTFEHHAHYLVLQESINAVRDAQERLKRIEQAIAETAPTWSLAPVVEAIQAMRGIDFISAVVFLAEVGDLSRFQHPGLLTSYLGITPSENSTGDSVRRGGLTKAGNIRARRILIECAWAYRLPARVSAAKQVKIDKLPKAVADIAWKAQARLCKRYRALTARGKTPTVAVVAVAREMAAFIWAIARQVQTSSVSA